MTGWDEKWEERPKGDDRAVRTRLFRTRRGFFEHEARIDYRFVNDADAGEVDEHELELDFELPFNRRFLMELEAEEVWLRRRDGTTRNGTEWAVRADLQLIDTRFTSMLLDFKVAPPSPDVDEERTTLGLTLASFHDLGRQVGLQWHVGNDFFTGAAAPDEPDNELNYALALTQTLTDDVPYFEHFTVFVEMYGVTELDGDNSGRTRVSFLPGIKWELGREWWFGAGYEIPLSGPRPHEQILHFQIVKEL